MSQKNPPKDQQKLRIRLKGKKTASDWALSIKQMLLKNKTKKMLRKTVEKSP